MVSLKQFETIGGNRLNQSKVHQNQDAAYLTVIAKVKKVRRDVD